MRRASKRLHRVVTGLALAAMTGVTFQTAGCGVASSGSTSGCESAPSTSDADARYLLITRVEDGNSNDLAWQQITLQEVDGLSEGEQRLVTGDPFVANPVNANDEFIADAAEEILGIARTSIPWLVDPGNLFFYWEPTEPGGDTDDADNGCWVIVFADELDGIPDDSQCTLVDANGDPAADDVFGADSDGDRVGDDQDLCPNTSRGDSVDSSGCSANDHLLEVTTGFVELLISDYVQHQLGVTSTFSF